MYLWKSACREGAHQIISKLGTLLQSEQNVEDRTCPHESVQQSDLLCAWGSDLRCNLKKGLELSEEENEGLSVFQPEGAALQ